MAPSYLTELLNKYVPKRENLRSNNAMSLHVPRSKLITAGNTSFFVATPNIIKPIAIPYSVCYICHLIKKSSENPLVLQSFCTHCQFFTLFKHMLYFILLYFNYNHY